MLGIAFSIIWLQMTATYQWLKGFEIFDFIVAEVQVRQVWAVFEYNEAIGNSVIPEFQLK